MDSRVSQKQESQNIFMPIKPIELLGILNAHKKIWNCLTILKPPATAINFRCLMPLYKKHNFGVQTSAIALLKALTE